MAAAILSIYHAVQACLSAYTGLLSYTSISKLQQYEEQSERAAQYSKTVEYQLHKTKTTQTSGALATLSSLTCAIILCASVSSEPSTIPLVLSTALTAGLGFAHTHIGNFWSNKAKIPFVTGHNDAINTSNQMRQALGALAISWGVSSLVYLIKFF